jgi:hypothetical protein
MGKMLAALGFFRPNCVGEVHADFSRLSRRNVELT